MWALGGVVGEEGGGRAEDTRTSVKTAASNKDWKHEGKKYL